MRRFCSLLLLALITVLVLSCDLQLLEDGASVNTLIHPYLAFEYNEDNELEAYVVADASLEWLMVPGHVLIEGETVEVGIFAGFRNPEDAQSLKYLTLENGTVLSLDALKQAVNLESVRHINIKEGSKWNLPTLPPTAEGHMVRWITTGGIYVGTGVEIDPNDSVATPVYEAHDWGDVIPGQAATCTEAGWTDYHVCQTEGCDYSTKDVIPALGHDIVQVGAKEATCTEAGHDAYEYCVRGDYTTYKEIPARGHRLTHVVAEEPTCTEDGNVEHWFCSNCNVAFGDEGGLKPLESVVIPATDHIASDKYKDYGGEYHKEVCAVCGTGFGKEILHIYPEDEYSKDADGHWQICSDCGHETAHADHEYVTIDDKTFCTICKYENRESTEGGFEVEVGSKAPKGDVTMVRDGDKYTFTFIEKNYAYPCTTFTWFVDNEIKLAGEKKTFEFEAAGNRTYHVYCMYSNGYDSGYKSFTVKGYE